MDCLILDKFHIDYHVEAREFRQAARRLEKWVAAALQQCNGSSRISQLFPSLESKLI